MRSGGLKKQVHPAITAIAVIGVLVAVQYAWYKGLIWRPPAIPPRPGGPTGSAPPQVTTISGRTDVTVDTLAGDLEPGDADGPGHAARFDRPTGLAIDAAGNVYVADTGNHRIRKIAQDGQATTLAGGENGFADGPADHARFNAPCGIAVTPDGALLVADTGNDAIRLIKDGQVTTINRLPAKSEMNGGGRVIGPYRPISVSYVAGVRPMVISAQQDGRGLHRYLMTGAYQDAIAADSPVTCVVASPNVATASPATGQLRMGSQTLKNVPIQGASAEKLRILHPVGIWPMGDAWLVTDSDHPAVFVVKNGSVEVVAGTCSSAEPMRGSRDGDGSKAQFGILSGIVSDGKGHVYVADTGNNSIRRITIPGGSL